MSLETNEKLSIWRLLLNLLNPIRILIEVNTRFLIKWGRFIVFKQKEYSSVACLPLKSSQNHRFLNCLMSSKSNFSCFSCFVDIVLMDLWIKSHQIATQWLILYYYNPHQNLDHVHPETQTAAFHVRWITRLPSCIISFTAQTSPHVSSSKLPLFWILYNSEQLLRWDRIQRAWRMEISYLESPPLLNDPNPPFLLHSCIWKKLCWHAHSPLQRFCTIFTLQKSISAKSEGRKRPCDSVPLALTQRWQMLPPAPLDRFLVKVFKDVSARDCPCWKQNLPHSSPFRWS